MSDSGSVLVVDDDEAVGKVLAALMNQAGHRATWVPSAESALAVLEKKAVFDLVISDVRMPGFSGLELLKMLRLRWPDMPVILITAHGTVPMAVEAMREGASDFLLKPFDREEVLFVVQKALTNSARERAAPPRPARREKETADGMVGSAPSLEEARALIRQVAPSSATVLILGETGTGKELAARALHALSPRSTRPFMRVDCGALHEHLLLAELFGYEKGAFTGAHSRKPGRVELAEGGTLFLDEVGELSADAQKKLLSLLQEKTFERLGGTELLKANVRIVAATHQSLPDMVKAKTFREDLYYRLNVVPIQMPPLRTRTDDVALLVKHFLSIFGEQNGRPKVSVSADALARLTAQGWPGNVRQLQNFIERLVVLAPPGDVIEVATVEREFARAGFESSPNVAGPASGESLPERRKDAERQAVEEALKKSGDNRTQAARILGVSRRTLYNKLEALGLLEP